MATCPPSINTSCPESLDGLLLSGTDHTEPLMKKSTERDGVELDDVVAAFVHRMANDLIIGFFFEGRDLARIILHERELLGVHLGQESAYTGRALGGVHKPLGINRGHFKRRHAILRNVCDEMGVEAAIVARWIHKEEQLEPLITTGIDCGPGE
jgi:truncated hemoglobin YjbI